MKDSTKRILLIGGSALVIGGILYYFFVYRKGQGQSETPPEEALDDQPSGVSTSGGGSASDIPTELNTTEKIKKFQDWMDTIGPWVKGSDGKYKLLNKGAGYGTYGPSTRAAWSYYKQKYLDSLKNLPEITVTADKDLTSSINLLLSNWKGDKEALRTRLAGEKRDFVIAWANAVIKFKAGQLPKNAFTYDNKVYDISWGMKRFDKSPIGKTAKTTAQTAIRLKPDAASAGKEISGTVGRVESYQWNVAQNLMWLYVPKNNWSSDYKWVFAGKVTV
jgi:hypothetical protein